MGLVIRRVKYQVNLTPQRIRHLSLSIQSKLDQDICPMSDVETIYSVESIFFTVRDPS
jgi:hypothetical protein